MLEAKRTVCWDRILMTVGLFCVTEEPPFLLMTLTRAGRKASHLTKDPLTQFMTCSKALPTMEQVFEVLSLFNHACYAFLKMMAKKITYCFYGQLSTQNKNKNTSA